LPAAEFVLEYREDGQNHVITPGAANNLNPDRQQAFR